jgi:hypothetical protein
LQTKAAAIVSDVILSAPVRNNCKMHSTNTWGFDASSSPPKTFPFGRFFG